MEEYLQRLRQLLTQGGITASDARDGMVTAYLVISRLNQLQGNPDVGLKQDEAGLQQHLAGFLGAIFWERGYNYDHPAVEQLSEIKMMMDGIAQIYAMPEEYQTALNEMCEALFARAANQPGVVSEAVLRMLDYRPEAAPEPLPEYTFTPMGTTAESTPEVPSETVTESVTEPVEAQGWGGSTEAVVEPVAPEVTYEPLPEETYGQMPSSEVVAESEAVQEVKFEGAPVQEVVAQKMHEELGSELVALFDEAMKEEPAAAPEAPAESSEQNASTWESLPESGSSDESTPPTSESAPPSETVPTWATYESAEPSVPVTESIPAWEPTPLAAAAVEPTPEEAAVPLPSAEASPESSETEPVKKKRGRKRLHPEIEPAPKAAKKKKVKAPALDAKDASSIVVPDDYMRAPAEVESQPLSAAASVEMSVAEEAHTEVASFSETSQVEEHLTWDTVATMPDSPEHHSTSEPSLPTQDGSIEGTVPAIDSGEAVIETESSSTGTVSANEEEVVSQPYVQSAEEEVVSQPYVQSAEEEVVSQPYVQSAEEEVVSQPYVQSAEEEVVSQPYVRTVEAEATLSAPAMEPVAQASAPTRRDVLDEGRHDTETREEQTGRAGFSLNASQDVEEEVLPAKIVWGLPLMVGVLVGMLLGAVPAWIVAKKLSAGDAELTKQSFEKQMNNLKNEMETVKGNADKMQATLREQEAAWRKAPDKPLAAKVGTGVMLYWNNEGMMRKYFVYRGKGPAGNMVKVAETPLDVNFMFEKSPEPGVWRYALSALTKEGLETDKGEAVVLTFPMR